MMTHYYLLAALCVVVPTATAKPTRCCTSSKLSGDVVYAGMTQYMVSLDFDKKKLLEEYDGNNGIDYVLGDGHAMVRYQRMMTGECKKYPVTQHKYSRCIPKDAVPKKVRAEYGVKLEGWIYNPNSNTSRLVVIQKDNCLPYRVQMTRDDKMHVVNFINVDNSVDSSVFDKDVSDCEDA